MFDVENNIWSPMKSMKSHRARFDAAQIDDHIYACGGSNGQIELKTAECYEPALDKWLPLPDMHFNRSSCGA